MQLTTNLKASRSNRDLFLLIIFLCLLACSGSMITMMLYMINCRSVFLQKMNCDLVGL